MKLLQKITLSTGLHIPVKLIICSGLNLPLIHLSHFSLVILAKVVSLNRNIHECPSCGYHDDIEDIVVDAYFFSQGYQQENTQSSPVQSVITRWSMLVLESSCRRHAKFTDSWSDPVFFPRLPPTAQHQNLLSIFRVKREIVDSLLS